MKTILDLEYSSSEKEFRKIEILPGIEHGYGYGSITAAQKKTMDLAAEFLQKTFSV